MRHLVATLAAGILCAGALSARQAQALPPLPQFRSGVDIVHLDVSVLDRNRRPVRGLTPQDFTILENGKPQQIAVFSAVDISDPTPPSAAWIRDIAPDVRTNDGMQERRLFLILIDDATIQEDLRAQRNVKDIARRTIDRLGPSDLAAVIFTRDNRNSQDFTSDRARLLTAVDRFSGGFRDMAPAGIAGADDLFFMYSANVVESAIGMLTTLPDRRKSIIYIGQGVPVDLDLLAPQAPGLPPNGGASALSRSSLMARIKMQMERVFERAARANVNVYTIDACGLRPIPPPAGAIGAMAPTCIPGLEVDYLQTVAANTGARVLVNTNDFEPGLSAIFQENASYYLLGFQPGDTRGGGLRRLEVKVNRADVDVRTRSGYEAAKPDEAKRLAASPLGAALAGVLPKSDLPLQMSAVPFPLPGRRESAVTIVLGVRQPIRQRVERAIEKVDLQVSAFNVEGKSFGSTRLRADVALRAGASGLAEYEVLSRIDLKPGRYQLRIAANVGSLSTSGSLYYDVDVPDVSAAPVSLSGLVLSVSPGPIVAPRDAFKGILPVVPTARRTFKRTDQVTAFTRIHQGGKTPLIPIRLRTQLRNAEDILVQDGQHDIAAAAFSSARAADVRMEVPVARLPPGAYLLTVETGLGTAVVRRDSRFEIER